MITPSTNAQIHYVLTADGSKATNVFRDVAREVTRSFQSVEAEARRAFAATAAEAQRAKATAAGRGAGAAPGTLGDVFNNSRLLFGGGAAAAVDIIGKKLARVTDNLIEMRDAIDSGEKSAAEAVETFAKGLPVIGGWVTAGRNIRELFTGEIAAANRELKLANEQMKQLQRNLETVNRIDDARGKARTDLARSTLEGGSLTRFLAGEDFKKNMDEVGRLRNAAGFSANAQKQVDELSSYYSRIYQAALVKAEDEDFKARQKVAEDIARKDEEMAREQARRAGSLLRLREGSLRSSIESRQGDLESQRDAVREAIQRGRVDAPRTSATAQAVTSVGAAEVLAASQRRSSDPGVKVMQEQKQKLESIEKELKELNRFAKAQAAINLGIGTLFPSAGTN